MEQIPVFQAVVLGRRGELLALGDFRIGVGLDEIRRAVGGEAEVDARVAIEIDKPAPTQRS